MLIWCYGIYVVFSKSQFGKCVCLFITIYASVGYDFVECSGLCAGF